MDVPTFDQIETDAWDRLSRGASDSHHPFHLCVLATVNGEGGPEARTVVLREATKPLRRVSIHTDRRSPKAHQIATGFGGGRVQMVFYTPQERIQVRLGGLGTVHFDDDLASARWDNSKRSSQLCYATPFASSQVVDHPPAAPESLAGPPPARHNFSVIAVEVEWIEWLHLHHAGHRRARVTYLGQTPQAVWLAP